MFFRCVISVDTTSLVILFGYNTMDIVNQGLTDYLHSGGSFSIRIKIPR
ncbi:unnamed protein product [Tenebrio molitor]|nr:unnamed protein product [Tenebrio molitor]